MRGFSKAIITGNLTRDPELRTTPSGAQVCSFSVAVNRTYRDASGNNQESVSYLDCVAWNRLAETIAQYAKKGSGVLVSGRLEQRSWEDKQTGQKRSRVEIVAEDFNFIGARNDNNGSNYNNNSYSSGGFTTSAPNDNGPASTGGDVAPEDIPEGEVDLNSIPF